MSLRLHPLFSDHAVVQRDRPLPVWGWAEPGHTIVVRWGDQEATTQAASDGRWEVLLPGRPAGSVPDLTVSAGAERLCRRDLVAGDVFLAAGQSNMDWALALVSTAGADIRGPGGDPDLRWFTVPLVAAAEPVMEPAAVWRRPTAQDAGACSAVAWYAAAHLRRARPGIPVGVVQAAWGGSAGEPWLSPRGGLALDGWRERWAARTAGIDLLALTAAERAARTAAVLAPHLPAFAAWHRDCLARDPGTVDGWERQPWTDGRPLRVPGFWPGPGEGPCAGIRWCACDIVVPAGADAAPGELRLGTIDNEDTTWWDGVPLGSTGWPDGPQHWNTLRRYPVPRALLAPGRHRIVVRVVNYGGRAGFGTDAEGGGLHTVTGTVPLPEVWMCRDGAAITVPPPPAPRDLSAAAPHQQPAALFHGMIAPLAPFPLAGIWWYQGESNADRAAAYGPLLRALIQDWRAWWRMPDDGGGLPFHVVQLTSFGPPAEPGADSGWAELRAAQAAALVLPGTTLTVIHDLGEPGEIHPDAKAPVGERLALAVRRLAGEPCDERGPRLVACTRFTDGVRLDWKVRGSLTTRNGLPVGGIALGDDHGTWRWAVCRIDGDAVIAHHPELPRPTRVRCGWSGDVLPFTLCDGHGLPAWPWAGPVMDALPVGSDGGETRSS